MSVSFNIIYLWGFWFIRFVLGEFGELDIGLDVLITKRYLPFLPFISHTFNKSVQ